MLYHVKVIPTNSADVKEPLEDDFDGIFINDNTEILFLYQLFIDKDGKKVVERISIPLNVIDTLEIQPIYEDNR